MESTIMDHRRANSSIIVAGSPQPKCPPRLRQTCDSCSEAKVKCDKGSPRCGRCNRLSYGCVYSPAKRVGRPRPRAHRSPGRDCAGTRCRDGGAADQGPQAPRPHLPTPATPAQPAQQPQAVRHVGLNLDDPVAESLSDDGYWATADGVGMSTGAAANQSDGMAAQSTGAPFGPPSLEGGHWDGSTPASSLPSLSDEAQGHPYEHDCATAAVATLGALAASGHEGRPLSSAADVLLSEEIPRACRQAARMLVCPCSAGIDRALLVASLVAAIIDAADAALRAPRPAGRALGDEQYTVLALGILPKISHVVTLFAHRYSATQACPPPKALLLLAASLRTTLQAVAEDMTERFLSSDSTTLVL